MVLLELVKARMQEKPPDFTFHECASPYFVSNATSLDIEENLILNGTKHSLRHYIFSIIKLAKTVSISYTEHYFFSFSFIVE